MSRLLLLQLDGLSRQELESNLPSLPCLRGLLNTSHRLHTTYSGLPSTTPAFQGEFFYGVRQCVPAWYFREAASGRLAQLIYRDVSIRREQQLSSRGASLLRGGAAYTCLLSGGAAQVHFGAGQTRQEYLAQLTRLWRQGPDMLRRSLKEAGLGLAQTCSARLTRQQFWDEIRFLPKRTLLHAMMNEYFRVLIPQDMAAGRPVLYANFLSYDCLAHLRGPDSEYARQSLPEIDRVLEELVAAANQFGYQVWVFSDHGQESTAAYDLRGSGVLAERLGVKALGADHGPVAHLYFRSQRKLQLARRLVEEAGVPQVMFRDEAGAKVLNRHGIVRLPQDWPAVLGEHHPFGPEAGLDLARMAYHPEAGQLIALGFFEGQRVTFLREMGSHGGAGPLETQAFALLPEQVVLRGSARGLDGPVARPLDLRRAALFALEGRTSSETFSRAVRRPGAVRQRHC
ncbi:MAG: alkaline phosphatase family protein [Vulcanimicrobiota bacterium]